MSHERRREAGDATVLRYITTRDGIPGQSWPCRVVKDSDDILALYIAAGSTYKNWHPHHSHPDRRLADQTVPIDILRLMFPGRWHSIWLRWQPDRERSFTGYYVNFEEPFRRTIIGFDTTDHTLDILVAPDLGWSWKDMDDFDARVRGGIYAEAFAAEVRAEADRVIAAIEARAPPFSGEWIDWTPDPAWTIPVLPPTWDTVPPALWERRRWGDPAAR
jgi:hypothetical protein